MNTLKTRFRPIAGVLTSAVIVAATSGCYTQLAASDRYDDRRTDKVVYVEDDDGNIVEEGYYDEDRYYEDDYYYRPHSYKRYFRTYYGDPFYPGYDPYWDSWYYGPSYRYAGWYDPFYYDPFYYGSSLYFGVSFGWPYYHHGYYRPYYSGYYHYPYYYHRPYYTYYDRPYYGTNKFKGTPRSWLVQPRRTLAGRGSLVDRTRVRRGYDRDAVGRSKTRDGRLSSPGVVRDNPAAVTKDRARSTTGGRTVTRSGGSGRSGSATASEGRSRTRSSGNTEGRTVRRGDRDSGAKSEYRSGTRRGGSEWTYDRRSGDSPRVTRRNSSRRGDESLRRRYNERPGRSSKSDGEVGTLRGRYNGDRSARRSRSSYDRRDTDRRNSSVGGSSYTPRPSREYIRGRSSDGERSRGSVGRSTNRSRRSYDAPARSRRSYDAPAKSRRSYDAPSRRSSSSRGSVSRSSGSRQSSPSHRSSGRSGSSSKSGTRSSSRSSRSSSRGSRR